MKLSTLDLRIFAAIVDQGGISAAARRLGREKSTISRDLAAMEDRLGLRLLHRTTRRVTPTEAGETLAAYARRVVEELEHAEAAMEQLTDAPRGVLKVTAPFAMIRHVIAPHLPRFLAEFPQVQLAFDPNTAILDLVENGIDLALRIGELPSSSLVARRLTETALVMVASPRLLAEAPVAAPADLAMRPILALSDQATPAIWALQDAVGKVTRVPVTPRIAINEPGILMDLILAGQGIGVLPEIYAAPLLAGGQLARVLPGHTLGRRPIHAVYPSRRQLSPKVRAFIDFLSPLLSP
jgi:DNA-binding transcriptional LysR family regulator